MEPKDIVTSLDWSKALKTAGWPQDGCMFYWQEFAQGTSPKHISYESKKGWEVRYKQSLAHDPTGHFAAPTAEEILRRLPKQTADDNFLTISPEKDGWAVYYETSQNHPRHTCKADTLANAAASMYVYLAENKLLP